MFSSYLLIPNIKKSNCAYLTVQNVYQWWCVAMKAENYDDSSHLV